MKFPVGRTVVTVGLLIVYGVVAAIWSRVLSQYQAIVAASQINDDGAWTNALAFWFRSSDLIGGIVFLVVVGILVWIWVPFVSKLFKQEN
ncbi:hypothetical protein HY947_02425 [Candidatus Gottesmanbacteria bacterium]|nr:hypothetical protein [Candidatus Gottesmanbacteria bacterium]